MKKPLSISNDLLKENPLLDNFFKKMRDKARDKKSKPAFAEWSLSEFFKAAKDSSEISGIVTETLSEIKVGELLSIVQEMLYHDEKAARQLFGFVRLSKDPRIKQLIIKLLREGEPDDPLLFHMLAEKQPDSLEKLLDAARDDNEMLCALGESLVKRDQESLTGLNWLTFAKARPLKKFFNVIKDAQQGAQLNRNSTLFHVPESLENTAETKESVKEARGVASVLSNLACALKLTDDSAVKSPITPSVSRKDPPIPPLDLSVIHAGTKLDTKSLRNKGENIGGTGLHMIAGSAPSLLPTLFDLAKSSDEIRVSLADIMPVQNRIGNSVLHVMAYNAPELLKYLFEMAGVFPDIKKSLRNALLKANSDHQTVLEMIVGNPEKYSTLFQDEVSCDLLLSFIAKEQPELLVSLFSKFEDEETIIAKKIRAVFLENQSTCLSKIMQDNPKESLFFLKKADPINWLKAIVNFSPNSLRAVFVHVEKKALANQLGNLDSDILLKIITQYPRVVSFIGQGEVLNAQMCCCLSDGRYGDFKKLIDDNPKKIKDLIGGVSKKKEGEYHDTLIKNLLVFLVSAALEKYKNEKCGNVGCCCGLFQSQSGDSRGAVEELEGVLRGGMADKYSRLVTKLVYEDLKFGSHLKKVFCEYGIFDEKGRVNSLFVDDNLSAPKKIDNGNFSPMNDN